MVLGRFENNQHNFIIKITFFFKDHFKYVVKIEININASSFCCYFDEFNFLCTLLINYHIFLVSGIGVLASF